MGLSPAGHPWEPPRPQGPAGAPPAASAWPQTAAGGCAPSPLELSPGGACPRCAPAAPVRPPPCRDHHCSGSRRHATKQGALQQRTRPARSSCLQQLLRRALPYDARHEGGPHLGNADAKRHLVQACGTAWRYIFSQKSGQTRQHSRGAGACTLLGDGGGAWAAPGWAPAVPAFHLCCPAPSSHGSRSTWRGSSRRRGRRLQGGSGNRPT